MSSRRIFSVLYRRGTTASLNQGSGSMSMFGKSGSQLRELHSSDVRQKMRLYSERHLEMARKKNWRPHLIDHFIPKPAGKAWVGFKRPKTRFEILTMELGNSLPKVAKDVERVIFEDRGTQFLGVFMATTATLNMIYWGFASYEMNLLDEVDLIFSPLITNIVTGISAAALLAVGVFNTRTISTITLLGRDSRFMKVRTLNIFGLFGRSRTHKVTDLKRKQKPSAMVTMKTGRIPLYLPGGRSARGVKDDVMYLDVRKGTGEEVMARSIRLCFPDANRKELEDYQKALTET